MASKMDIRNRLEEKLVRLDWLNWRVIADTLKFLFLAALLTLQKFLRAFRSPKEKSLKDEVILITGSANGLGKEICLQLVSSEATLVLWDVAADENARVARELRDLGAKRVIVSIVDVSDREKVKEAAFKLRHEVGPVTVLINNAGIAPMQPFFQMRPEVIQKTFEVNVLSQFWTLQEFLPDMIKMNKGHIVTICSTMGLEPMRGCIPYVATKHAIHALVESMKDELHHLGNCENIKFTTAYPFFIKTKLVDETSGLKLKFRIPLLTPFMEVEDAAAQIVQAMKYEQEILIMPDQLDFWFKFVYPFMHREVHHAWVDYTIKDLKFIMPANTETKKFSIEKREDIALSKEEEITSKSF